MQSESGELIVDVIRRLHSLTPYSIQLLIRQLDSIRVLPFPFVLLGKNLFEPVRLSRSSCLVHECGIMKDDELLTATVTPKSAHLLEIWCSLSRLTLLDRHCFHRSDILSGCAPSGFTVRTVVPARTTYAADVYVPQSEQVVYRVS